MSTIITELNVRVSDQRSSRQVMSLRSSFPDVDTETQQTFELSEGEARTIVAEHMMCLHLRDKLDLVIQPAGTSASLALSQVVGPMTLPFGATVRISTPIGVATDFKSVVTVFYS